MATCHVCLTCNTATHFVDGSAAAVAAVGTSKVMPQLQASLPVTPAAVLSTPDRSHKGNGSKPASGKRRTMSDDEADEDHVTSALGSRSKRTRTSKAAQSDDEREIKSDEDDEVEAGQRDQDPDLLDSEDNAVDHTERSTRSKRAPVFSMVWRDRINDFVQGLLGEVYSVWLT